MPAVKDSKVSSSDQPGESPSVPASVGGSYSCWSNFPIDSAVAPWVSQA